VVGVLRLAVLPGAVCGGCDVALASLGERLLELLKHYEVVYWPTVVDRKLSDLLKLDSVDVLIHMGGISTEEEAELAREISSRARVKVSFGTCSVYGDIPGLNSLYTPEEVYEAIASQVDARIRSERLGLPRPIEYSAYTDIVEPDVLAPGCPPDELVLDQLFELLVKYAETRRLEARLVLLGDSESLCDKCPRNPKTSKVVVPGIKRLYEVRLDENKCFLEQGVLCMGPATRAICDHSCIRVNYPCTGCGGPVEWGSDAGLSAMSAAASALMADMEKAVLEPGLARELDKIRDAVGSFYRYTLRKSLIYKLKKTRSSGE
jgi:F420-non-reducing hydrogenase small subunit